LKKKAEKIERLNLLLRSMYNVRKLLAKEKDRSRLLQGICYNLIENRGYYNAWIALLDDSKGLVATAQAGLDQGFLPMVERLKQGDLTHCAQRALTQPEVVLIDDPFSTCMDCPLSTKYAGRGAMSVRLEYSGKVYGLLSISIPADFVPDEEEHELVEEVAGDIAFGLHTIEVEEEHRKVDEALHKSEKRFRDLIENCLVGISILQGDQVIYQNPEQERLLGPLPRPPKLTEIENIHPDDAEKVKEFYQNMASGKVHTQETDFRFYPLNELGDRLNMKWVSCRTSSIEYGGKEAILVNMMDVTRAKELENYLRIQDKMSSLGRVTAGIAHEIRNPLSGINIYLGALEKMYYREGNLEKVKQIFDQLKSASNKIESVIRRVMDFSKPSEPKLVLTDINKPIEEAINLSSVTLRKRGIKLEKALAEDMQPCRADPHLIEQVVLNLITNAAEAMDNVDGAKIIEVTSSMDKNRIIVRISDSGPGIPLYLQEKVFDPFYTTKDGSTGIGLSLCHRIITDHGGSFGVVSSKWGGAEFTVEIPIGKARVQV
jgi:PAS domain S-box-containing protein